MNWSNLVQIIHKLRSPEGCPWDRKQTHDSLKRFLLEESYELFEAIDQEDPEAIKDELGDVLLQVLLHAEIGREKGAFSIDDVISNLAEKIVRRHPHVFGDVTADTPEQVLKNWEAVKKTEQNLSERVSALDGVPSVFPALMRAEKIQKKAAKVGFDWDDTPDVVEKIHEELTELEQAMQSGLQEDVEDELGDLLFATVNLSRFVDVDPEFALQKATAKFVERFHLVESYAKEEGVDMNDLNLDELNLLWDRAKDQLRKKPQV
ncbi:MAG TPA: nucleoside triphosphate pyrophosphohydrolase [Limnochordia bacterium]|jgi:tetrapyrrole methylase family protein/MazG family protein|nr:nucleoside triphosphate pyrophosphohydrolase [Bacillota bacterium]HKM43199.1 nucleoside triphosphate pyrophosphohydrolase [Limnochordia bacterium]